MSRPLSLFSLLGTTLLLLSTTAIITATTASAQEIISLTPNSGSILGGTRVSILGTGFDLRGRSNDVYIGTDSQGVFCDPIPNECHDKRIVCITAPFEGRGTFPLRVRTHGVTAECKVRWGCTFSYDYDRTPVITGVSPEWITTPQSLTITGTGFDRGDRTIGTFDMYVYLGDEERCDVGSNPVSSVSFVCDAHSGIFPGTNRLSIMFGSRGWAVNSNRFHVLVIPTILGVAPATGSIEGGQQLTIFGTGFSRTVPENTVTVHGAPCVPTVATENYLVCTTSAHSATELQPRSFIPGARVEYWARLDGAANILNLRSKLSFLNPEVSVSSTFGGDIFKKMADRCAVRVTGYFVPNVTGAYNFSVVMDDLGELWMSEDENPVPYVRQYVSDDMPFNDAIIATRERYYSTFTTPTTRHLVAGKRYWMQAYVLNSGSVTRFYMNVTYPDGSWDVNPSDNFFFAEDWAPPVTVTSRNVSAMTGIPCMNYSTCDFHYTNAATAVISAVSPASIKSGETLTLTGTDFPATRSSVAVITIGGVQCVSNDMTSTRIRCVIATETPAGVHNVQLFVAGSGKAVSAAYVTVEVAIVSVDNTKGYTRIVAPSIATLDAAALSVTVGGKPCTAVEIVGNEVHCAAASGTSGTTTATITVQQQRKMTIQKGFTYAQQLVRPGTTTAMRPPMLVTTEGSMGGEYPIIIVVPQWTLPANASSQVRVTLDSNPCVVTDALASRITCIAPAVTSVGNKIVTVSYKDETITVPGSISITHEVTSMNPKMLLSPSGGNMLEIKHNAIMDGTPVISWRGVPCKAIDKQSHTSVRCYIDDSALTKKVSLPLLSEILPNTPNAERLLWGSDDVRFTAGGFVVPKGGFLFTRRSFDTSLRVTATIIPSSDNDCISLSAHSPDPTTDKGGVTAFAKDGKFYIARDTVLIWGSAVSNTASMPAQTTATWKLEVNSGYSSLFINGEYVAGTETSRLRNGFVGFPPACQDITVTSIKIEDLTPDGLAMSIGDEPVGMNFEPPLTLSAPAFTVVQPPTQILAGTDTVSLTVRNYDDVFELLGFPKGTNDFQLLPTTPQLCKAKVSLQQKFTTLAYVKCDAADVPAGSYQVRLRHYRQGFSAQKFNVDVIPVVRSILTPTISYYGGYIRISVYGAGGATSDWSVTIGNTTSCPVSHTMVGSFIECRAPAVTSETALGPFTITITHKPTKTTMVTADSLTYMTADKSPVITSFGPIVAGDGAKIPFTGTNYGSYGTFEIGSVLCQVWNADRSCSFGKVFPNPGTYPVKYHARLLGFAAPTGLTVTITRGVTTPASAIAAASGSTLQLSGTALQPFNGLSTTVASFDYTKGTLERDVASRWTVTNGDTSLMFQCGSLWSEFGGMNTFDAHTLLTRTLTGIATHTFIGLEFDVYFHGKWNSQSTASVTVDGVEYTVPLSQNAYSSSNSGILSRCGSGNGELDSRITLVVPHTRSTMKIEFRGLVMGTSSGRSWGLKSYRILAGTPSLQVTVGGSNCRLQQLSLNTITCTLPRKANGTEAPIVVADGSKNLACDGSCSVFFTDAKAPSITAVTAAAIPARHTGRSITWSNIKGIDSYRNGPRASLTRYANSPYWSAGAISQQWFYKSDGLRGLRCYINGSAECGLTRFVNDDGTNPNLIISHGIYTESTQVVAMDGGSWRFKLGPYGYDQTYDMIINDDDTVSYLIDGVTRFMTNWKVQWPLHVATTVMGNANYDSSVEVEPLFASEPVAADDAPIIISGPNIVAGASAKVNNKDCPPVVSTVGAIICYVPRAQAAIGSVLSVGITSDGTTLPAASFTVAPNIDAITPTKGSTLGSHLVTISGGGFSVKPTVTIGGVPCTVRSYDYGSITCLTGAHIADSSAAVTVSVSGVNAVCSRASRVEPSNSDPTEPCPVYTYEEPTGSISSTSIDNSKRIVTVSGVIPKRSGTVSLLLGDTLLSATDSTESSATIAIPTTTAAGTYNAVVMTEAGGALGTAAVAVPLTVSVSPARIGSLGGAVITFSGSNFGPLDGLSIKNGDSDVCSSMTLSSEDANTVLCVTTAGTFTSVTIQTSQGASKVVAVEASSSSTPTITGVTPTNVAAGSMIAVRGSNLDGVTSISVGGVPCEGPSGSASTLVCRVGGVASGSLSVQVTAGAKGSSAAFSGVSGDQSVWSVTPERAPAGSTVTIHGSAFEQSKSYTVTIGGLSCDNVAVASTSALTCTIQYPAKFVDGSVDVEVKVAAGTVATASASYLHTLVTTPVFTAVSPSSGSKAGGDILTITGSGFSDDVQQVNISIGGVRCLTTFASPTEVHCTTDPMPLLNGATTISLSSQGIPAAATKPFTVRMAVTAISPSAPISVEGGVDITLSGTGFPDMVRPGVYGLAVTVGYIPCPIVSTSRTKIVCTAPARPYPYTNTVTLSSNYVPRGDGTGIIRVAVNGTVANVDDSKVKVEWRQDASPTVSVVAGRSTVRTGDSLTITGTDFAASGNRVDLVEYKLNGGLSSCDITSESATRIVCSANLSTFGRHFVRVQVPNKGYAYTSQSCPSGQYMMCDGSCIAQRDCSYAAWGFESNCEGLLGVFVHDTYCHSNGGSDRVDQPFILDTGKTLNLNCPMYSCEGKDCNATITIGGFGGIVNTCGKDPMGYMLDLRPSVSSVRGSKSSGIYGGNRLTIIGTNIDMNSVVRLGDNGAFCTPVETVDGGVICETSAFPQAVTDLEMTVYTAGTQALCSSACKGFSYVEDVPTVTGTVEPAVNRGVVPYYAGQSVTITGTGFSSSKNKNTVAIGGVSCPVSQATSTQLVCVMGALSTGDYQLSVRVDDVGLAGAAPFKFRVRPTIYTINDGTTTMSMLGGATITVTGSALDGENRVVSLGKCDAPTVVSASMTQLVLRLAPCNVDNQPLSVAVSGSGSSCQAPSCNLRFRTQDTPSAVITSVGGNTHRVLINSSAITTLDTVTVQVGFDECKKDVSTFAAASGTFECDAPATHAAGTYPVTVIIRNIGALSVDTPYTLTYNGAITAMSPASGSLAGGQRVTITGSGFATQPSQNNVTLAGFPCSVLSATSTELICSTLDTKATTDKSGQVELSLVAEYGSGSLQGGTYSYLAADTPTITSVSPNQGSTAGGTLITIKGTNLASDNVVSISGVLCAQSESQKAVTDAAGGKLLVCTTGAYTTSLDSTLFVTGPRGAARGTVSYQYIDLWSRWTTWGNNAPPGEGDSAVISEGQTVMYNYNAPRFHLVVVMGHLMFEDSSDLLLRCTYIMINFGRMTVGTPENPFTHKATIRLYGDRLTPEIPVHGSKVLALRHGALDMHGVPRQPTWTMLAAHAREGETSIKVRGPVDWKAGEEIAIASSSFYMDEAEVRHIVSVSQVGDVATLQLDMPLNYYHNGVKECFDNGKICIEEIAEVALLTRNIVVEGDSDSQTIGFGGTMFLMPMGETNDRYARLSFIELRDVGQEYIVGRYPVHYHVTGSTNTSYVNGTSVHRSLNRAFSIHGISNNTYVNNVVYDTKGHAFFIEDGSEKHNVIKNNLVIIARTSTSNLNTDITPACFWVVSPLNYLDGNHAAGCGAYGFWIAPFHPHSTGPTYSPNICPSTHRMWHFENNVAHAAKKYGLNIFQYWWPKEKECDENSADAPAVIRNHFSWKNKIHGVSVAHSEVGEVGAVSFDHLVSSSNGEEHEDSSAFWIEHIKADNMSVGLRNSVLIAQTSNQPQRPTETRRGVNLPLGDNFYTYDTTFVNYDGVNFGFEPQRWAERLSFCFPWGWEATSRGLRWVNSPNRIRFRFPHHGLLNDEDGSLAGTAGTQIIPTSPLLSPTKCQSASVKTNRPASVCANDYKLRRFGVDSVSEYFPDQLFTCDGQEEIVPVIKQRYSMHMPMNSLVNIKFLSPANPAKWTWTISPRFCAPDEKIMLQTTYPEHRDHVNASFGGRMGVKLNRMPTFSDPNSSFYFDNETGMLTTLLLPSDGDIGTVAATCPWNGCSVAPSQPTSMNEPCRSWEDPSSWASGKVPEDGADLRVNYTESICLDNPGKVYHLRSLLLEGKFEVNNTFCNGKKENKIRLVVDKFIHVRGGILQAGTEETPFDACQFEIVIKQVERADTKASQVLPWQPRSLVMESGTIDLHGAGRVRYATLVSTAAPGATSLALDRDVDWQVGERIGISMTRMHKMHAMGNNMLEESENATITAISGRTITLDRALQYEHSGSGPVTLNGKQYVIGAEVVLMSRNIHINGGHADEEIAQYGGGWNFMVGCTEEGTPGCGTRDPDDMGYPMGPKKLGTLRLNNVQFSDMGAAGALPSAFSFDGLITNGAALTAEGSYVKGCAFYKSYNTQLDVTVTTKGMVIANNSFYSINGDAIRIGSRNNVIEGNLVIRNLELKPRCDFTYEYNDDATCVGAAYRINWGNKVVGNIAASGLAAGFMTYGEPCDQPFQWKDNIVHNHKDGLLLNDMLDNKDWNWQYRSPECRKAGAVLAYRNADSGVATWSVRGHVTMSNIVTVENSIGVSASLYLLGNDKGVKEYVYTLEDSTISGHWPDFKCSAERQMPCAGSLLNSRFWCETIYGGNPLKIGHVGILETFFIQSDYALRNVGEHKFRWTEPDSYATLRGRAVHRNLFIDNFAGTNDCGQKEVGFINNIYSNDTFHQHTFEGIRWGDNVPEGGETYAWTMYGNISGHKTEHEQSVWLDFDNKKFGAYWPDSPNKFWIVDKDGSFTRSGSGPAHVFGSKTLTRKAPFSTYKWDGRVFVDESKLKDVLGANREGCAWNSKWNAHKCGGDGTKHHYVSLAIDSLAADKFTRRAGPVVMCKGDGMVGRDGYPLCQGGEVDFASGPVMKGKTQRATLDRLSRWRFNVENNQNYTLYFRGQAPVWIRYVLTNYEYTGLSLKDVGITINLRYFGLDSKLRCGIYVDGVRQPSSFGYGNPFQQNPPSKFPMPLDPAGTHYHNKGIKDGVEVNVMSATVRPGTILEFKQEDIVIINMDVSMNLEDFFNNKDTFVAALVQVLSIEASRVRFARIVAGTAGRHMAAQAPSGKTSLTIEIEPANHTMQANIEKPMAEITTDLKEVAKKAAALPRTLDTFTVSEVAVKDHTVDVLPPSIIVVGPLNYMVLNVSTAKGVEFNMSTVLRAVYNYTVDHLLSVANATNHTLKSREVSHGNTYFFTTGNFTRFTLFFSLSEDDDLSNLLSYELYKSLASDAAVIMPPGYTVVDKRYVDRVEEGPAVVPTNIPTTPAPILTTTNTTNNDTAEPQSLVEAAFLSAPLVVAIAVVASVMAVVLIGVGVWLYCRRRRVQKSSGFRKRTMTLNAAENLSPDMFNYVKADGKDGPITHAEFDIPLPPQEELEEISKRDENMNQQDRYRNIDRVEDALYDDGPAYSQNKYRKSPNPNSSHNGSPVSSPTKRVNVGGEFFDI